MVRPIGRSYAALGRFLDGYLHQDFRVEHRTATAAARAYARDASPAQRRAVAEQLERFLDAAEGTRTEEWRDALHRIGGAWRPRSLAEVRAVLAAIDPAAG